MEARVVVFAPPRLYSVAESFARNLSTLYAGVCSLDVLVVPSLDDTIEPSVVAEGSECGLTAAELIQSMLWVFEAMGIVEPSIMGVEHVLSTRAAGDTGTVAP